MIDMRVTFLKDTICMPEYKGVTIKKMCLTILEEDYEISLFSRVGAEISSMR